ncbi:MAG: hypothetical protein PUI16_00440 [Clostridia bacterium]|nr:hypothetical protein [Clostridia bacterium]MDY5554731.1 hypothetical protein [Blautia sp.]
MKKCSKILMLVFCLLMVQIPIITVASGETVQAATAKSGLKKEKGKYYYYEKGKKVKNTWKTIKTRENGKTVSFRYYFGKDGAAYAAGASFGKYNVIVKKIKGVYYGFDTKGRLVKGIYVNGDNLKFYAFTKKGVYDSKKSSALRKAAQYGADGAALRKLLGKPLKEKTSDSCMTVPGTDIALTDVILTYNTFTVSLGRYPDGSKEMVYGAIPR